MLAIISNAETTSTLSRHVEANRATIAGLSVDNKVTTGVITTLLTGIVLLF